MRSNRVRSCSDCETNDTTRRNALIHPQGKLACDAPGFRSANEAVNTRFETSASPGTTSRTAAIIFTQSFSTCLPCDVVEWNDKKINNKSLANSTESDVSISGNKENAARDKNPVPLSCSALLISSETPGGGSGRWRYCATAPP